MKAKQRFFLFTVITAMAMSSALLIYRHNNSSPVAKNDAEFLNRLNSVSDFRAFSGAPLDNAYTNVSSVKAVYDLNRRKIYFINSSKYRLHFDFCEKVLGYSLGLRLFNIENYGTQRQYYLANINYLKKTDQYVLEFGSSDEIDSLQIDEMYMQVKKNSFIGNKLSLLLNNTNTLRYYGNSKSIPSVGINALNEGLSYQPVQEGVCSGRLVFCNDLKKEYLSVRPGDIIIVKGTPADVPLCQGILSDCFQTPLSHIQVLSHNKKIPSAFLQNVFENKAVRALEDKFVRLTVLKDTLFLSPDVTTAVSAVPANKRRMHLNNGIRRLIPLSECSSLAVSDIGTKAKGLSDLNIISEENDGLFKIPEGAFVIPFYFFSEHMARSNVNSILNQVEQCDAGHTSTIDSLLRIVRDRIMRTPLSQLLLAGVNRQVNLCKCGSSFRFRSSSNAEDLQNFNGAGLYDSKTGQLDNTKKSVERAIKKVWSSLYNYRAYQERRYAGIDETTVGMSVLAHRNFPAEDINGVAISKNIYRDDYPGTVINAQKGDVSVVSPPDSVKCEQLILTENSLMNPFSKRVSAKYLCYSSLNNDKPLVAYEQLLRLQKSMKAIKEYYSEKNLDWDIEFKFENAVLYIKQVRPYN